MTRAIFGELLFFFLPFAVFAIYLLLRRRDPLAWDAWSGQVSWLTIAGLGLVVATLVFAGVTADRQQGPYTPTHMENGRLVPGEFPR